MASTSTQGSFSQRVRTAPCSQARFLQGQGGISGRLCSRGEWKVLRSGCVLLVHRASDGLQLGASWTAPSDAAEGLLHGAAHEREGCSCTRLPGYSLSCFQMYFISTFLLVGRKPELVCVGGSFRETRTEGRGTEAVSVSTLPHQLSHPSSRTSYLFWPRF